MADDKIRMPSSGGGLMRYYDEYKSKIEIPPTAIIITIVVVIVLAIILHSAKPL